MTDTIIKDTISISKEEEFLKEFKTLIKELVRKLFETTNDHGDYHRAKKLLAALEELDVASKASNHSYF